MPGGGTAAPATGPDRGLTRSAGAWADRLHAILGVPPTDGNEIRVLRNGDEIFPAMLGAIDDAVDTVDLVTFVYWTGDIACRFADTLAAAARRGCRVRVLVDAVGGRSMDDELFERMRSAGVDIRWFRPVFDRTKPAIGDAAHRTHRKLLVCDGRIGFTGGVGIAREWTGDARNADEWRDTHVAVRGPAVAGLQAAFADNWGDTPSRHDGGSGGDTGDDGGPNGASAWFDARDEPLVDLDPVGSSRCMVVSGAAETGASDLWRLLVTLIQLAEERLRVTTAYFNPDDRIVEELIAAVERGVEVQLLLPGEHHDKRFVQINGQSRYAELLDAGVDLRTYERTMLHAKVVTVDRVVATIGSANVNDRSMQHDEECNLVVLDPDVVAALDRHFDDDLHDSIVLDPARWADRSWLRRVGERLSRVADRWL